LKSTPVNFDAAIKLGATDYVDSSKRLEKPVQQYIAGDLAP
jgi:hypothetical protein